MTAPLPIFDGHNDTLLRLYRKGLPVEAFFEHGEEGHLDLPRAREGGFAGGLFACFVPSESPDEDLPAPERGGYQVPFPRTPGREKALAVVNALAARLERVARASGGEVVTVPHRRRDPRRHRAGKLTAVLHIEGAEAIDPDLEALEVLHAAGLRSLGPVWSRPNIFGHGVPFRFPSLPDTGPGLTDAGKALVRACNELRIMLDLSHLNEAGFWDVAALTDAPLVATHSNAHELCPCSRNLTDKQLDAIRETRRRGGLEPRRQLPARRRPQRRRHPAGDAVRPCRAPGRPPRRRTAWPWAPTSTAAPCRPRIRDAAGLPHLLDALRGRGWGEPELRKFAHENWLRVLERDLGRVGAAASPPRARARPAAAGPRRRTSRSPATRSPGAPPRRRRRA